MTFYYKYAYSAALDEDVSIRAINTVLKVDQAESDIGDDEDEDDEDYGQMDDADDYEAMAKREQESVRLEKGRRDQPDITEDISLTPARAANVLLDTASKLEHLHDTDPKPDDGPVDSHS